MQIRLEVVPWLTTALGHEGSGKLAMTYACQTGNTVGNLLSELVAEHPALAPVVRGADGSLSCPHVNLSLNGKLLSVPRGLEQPLVEGDVLVLFPPFAGG